MRILLKNIEVQNPFEESFVTNILIVDGKIEKIIPLYQLEREKNQCEDMSI